MKHTKGDLAQMQSLPLRAKILMTKQRIKAWYDYWDGQVYVSFSGGKDSTVLLHIAREVYSDIEAVFVNTGLEYPEIQRFIKTFDNVTILRPKMRFDEVIKKYGYPIISKETSQNVYEARKNPKSRAASKFDENSEYVKKYGSRYCLSKWNSLLESDIPISHMCCNVMKKKPTKDFEKLTGKKPILATMAEESALRETQWLAYGCNAFDSKRPRSTPMSFWTEQDVLQYIKENNIPIASVYGDVVYKENRDQMRIEDYGIDCGGTDKLCTTGCYRTGCMFCAFGAHLEKGESRFERLKRTHPRQYEYCIGGGEYVTKGYYQTSSGEYRSFVFEHDNGTPCTPEEIEIFIEECKDNPNYKFERKWQPNKQGLGMGHVFDGLNKIYGEDFIKY